MQQLDPGLKRTQPMMVYHFEKQTVDAQDSVAQIIVLLKGPN